jgi:chromate transport protein ChrA
LDQGRGLELRRPRQPDRGYASVFGEQKKWIGEQRFLHAPNYCMKLTGPEAQKLAMYVGWLLQITKGDLGADTLFVLPGSSRS